MQLQLAYMLHACSQFVDLLYQSSICQKSHSLLPCIILLPHALRWCACTSSPWLVPPDIIQLLACVRHGGTRPGYSACDELPETTYKHAQPQDGTSQKRHVRMCGFAPLRKRIHSTHEPHHSCWLASAQEWPVKLARERVAFIPASLHVFPDHPDQVPAHTGGLGKESFPEHCASWISAADPAEGSGPRSS